MKPLRIILIVAIATFLFLGATGQPGPQDHKEKKEKIEAMKIAFITEKLSLTSKEAQVFWPVYNEYKDARDKIRKENKELMKKCQDDKLNLSDKELEEMADKHIDLEMQEAKLSQAFHEKIKKALPIQKVVKFYRAEVEFKHQLLKQLKDKKDTGVHPDED